MQGSRSGAGDALGGAPAVRGEGMRRMRRMRGAQASGSAGQQRPLPAPNRSASRPRPTVTNIFLSVEVPGLAATVPGSGPSFPPVMPRVVAAVPFCAFASLIPLEKYQERASLADGSPTSALTTVISRMG